MEVNNQNKRYYQKKNIGPFQFYNEHTSQWCLFIDGRIAASENSQFENVPIKGRGHLAVPDNETPKNLDANEKGNDLDIKKSRRPRVGLF